uniref:Uncharacterized protein n=1 Tax=Physcomitrium patens TaxID=3218 RepID=A0A7I4EUQ0_PHYPA
MLDALESFTPRCIRMEYYDNEWSIMTLRMAYYLLCITTANGVFLIETSFLMPDALIDMSAYTFVFNFRKELLYALLYCRVAEWRTIFLLLLGSYSLGGRRLCHWGGCQSRRSRSRLICSQVLC